MIDHILLDVIAALREAFGDEVALEAAYGDTDGDREIRRPASFSFLGRATSGHYFADSGRGGVQ